jgi:hypothetical protein
MLGFQANSRFFAKGDSFFSNKRSIQGNCQYKPELPGSVVIRLIFCLTPDRIAPHNPPLGSTQSNDQYHLQFPIGDFLTWI